MPHTGLKMTPRIQAVLDQIDMVLVTEDGEALWSILSALRGPDYEDQRAKTIITQIIRAKAFPLCFGHSGLIYDLEFYPSLRLAYLPSHFIAHAQDAFVSLSLRWNEKNPSPAGESREQI